MFSLILENEKGEMLNVTRSDNFIFADMKGLDPPTAVINTSVIGLMDGQKFNSIRQDIRNIELYIWPKNKVETNRILFYKMFKAKSTIKLHLKNGQRDVWIEGIILDINCDLFTPGIQEIQAVIRCNDPYFKGTIENITIMDKIKGLFEFPFSVNPFEVGIYEKNLVQNVIYNGEVDSGITIIMEASGAVVNPRIYNKQNKVFGFTSTLQAGDIITIVTTPNKKSATLFRNGLEINMLNYILSGVEWFKLGYGDNLFAYECDSGEENLSVTFKHYDQYEAI